MILSCAYALFYHHNLPTQPDKSDACQAFIYLRNTFMAKRNNPRVNTLAYNPSKGRTAPRNPSPDRQTFRREGMLLPGESATNSKADDTGTPVRERIFKGPGVNPKKPVAEINRNPRLPEWLTGQLPSGGTAPTTTQSKQPPPTTPGSYKNIKEETKTTGDTTYKEYTPEPFYTDQNKKQVNPTYNTSKLRDIAAGASVGMEQSGSADVWFRFGSLLGGAIGGALNKNLAGKLEYERAAAKAEELNTKELAKTQAQLTLESKLSSMESKEEKNKVDTQLKKLRARKIEQTLNDNDKKDFINDFAALDNTVSTQSFRTSFTPQYQEEVTQQYRTSLSQYFSMTNQPIPRLESMNLDEMRRLANDMVVRPDSKAESEGGVYVRRNLAGLPVAVLDPNGNIAVDEDSMAKIRAARDAEMTKAWKDFPSVVNQQKKDEFFKKAYDHVKSDPSLSAISFTKNGKLSGLGVKLVTDFYTGLLRQEFKNNFKDYDPAFTYPNGVLIKASEYGDMANNKPENVAKPEQPPATPQVPPKPITDAAGISLANESISALEIRSHDTTLESTVRGDLETRLSGLNISSPLFESQFLERLSGLQSEIDAASQKTVMKGSKRVVIPGDPVRKSLLEMSKTRMEYIKHRYVDPVPELKANIDIQSWMSAYDQVSARTNTNISGVDWEKRKKEMEDMLPTYRKKPVNLTISKQLITDKEWQPFSTGGSLVWSAIVTNSALENVLNTRAPKGKWTEEVDSRPIEFTKVKGPSGTLWQATVLESGN